jgi:hypothetical protein
VVGVSSPPDTPTQHCSRTRTWQRICCQLCHTLWVCRTYLCMPQLRHQHLNSTVSPQAVASHTQQPPTTPPQDDWLKRAELAVSKGEDELAREALKRRKAYQVSGARQTDISGGARKVLVGVQQQAGTEVMCLLWRQGVWGGISPWAPQDTHTLTRAPCLPSCPLQEQADSMKMQLEAQQKAVDQLIANTR